MLFLRIAFLTFVYTQNIQKSAVVQNIPKYFFFGIMKKILHLMGFVLKGSKRCAYKVYLPFW